MVKHLKLLYAEAQINGKTMAMVFVDVGAILNIMPFSMLMTLGKRQKDIILTNLKMTNFTRGATVTLGVFVAKMIVGPKHYIQYSSKLMSSQPLLS